METIFIRIMWYDFKRNQNYEKYANTKKYENSWHRSHKTNNWKMKQEPSYILVKVETKGVVITENDS